MRRAILYTAPIFAGICGDIWLVQKFDSDIAGPVAWVKFLSFALAHAFALAALGYLVLLAVSRVTQHLPQGRTGSLVVAAAGFAVVDILAQSAQFTNHWTLDILRGCAAVTCGLILFSVWMHPRWIEAVRWITVPGVSVTVLLVVTTFGSSALVGTPKYLRESIQAIVIYALGIAWLLLQQEVVPISESRNGQRKSIGAALLAITLCILIDSLAGHKVRWSTTAISEFTRSTRNANRQAWRIVGGRHLPLIDQFIGPALPTIPHLPRPTGESVNCSPLPGSWPVKNVVLLTFDALRNDRYGVPMSLTPSWQRLQQRSIEFTNFKQAATGTSGGLFSFLVGRYPTKRSETPDTFPAVAKARGLALMSTPAATTKGLGLSDAERTDLLLRHMARQDEQNRPFIAHVHYMDLHLPAGAARDGHSYEESMGAIDKELGRVLDYLEEKHLWNSTLLIVSADHGEELRHERGYDSHGYGTTESLFHVPLLIRAPNQQPAQKNALVSSVDVLPTITALLGVGCNYPFHGRSLLELPDPERAVFGSSSSPRPNFKDGLVYSDNHAVWLNDWKLALNRSENALALYNLAEDPRELSNVADSNPAKLHQLRTLLEEHLSTSSDLR